jgi:glycolate oxidase
MERDAIDWTLKFVDGISVQVKEGIKAHLLIEVDGNYPDILCKKLKKYLLLLNNLK